jgi:rhodanese-related sulfurtransferase
MFGVPEISGLELARILAEAPHSIQLVDVRTPQEMSQGIIPGADGVPLHLVPLKVGDWKAEPKPMIIYCRTGARSAQAAAFLAEHGGERQYINLRGGILEWVQNGGSVIAPGATNNS